jgi:osmotically-inducible protein OsmY
MGWSLVAIVALAVGVGTPAAAAPISDADITRAVEDEYMNDLTVPYDDINVVTVEGIVTLSGAVSHLAAKQRAAAIAEQVKGVRSVVNELTVEPAWQLSDGTIERDVIAALQYDPATESWEIGVDVSDGTVTLTGAVDSWTESQLAEQSAAQVKGVREVVNNIEVEYDATRSDSEIQAEVEQSLRWNVLVDDALIDVDVDDSVVTLTGTVGSAAEKLEAGADAWVTGVEAVNVDDLSVERWARDDDLRHDMSAEVTDVAIADAVDDALFYDPRVTAREIDITVSNGTVTLRGDVPTLRAKRAAAQDARNTVGVIDVDNRIRVRAVTPMTDMEVAEAVADAFERDPYVERYEIGVTVVDGVATLSGAVDTYFEKVRAENLASQALGVVRVSNHLDVEYTRDPLITDPYLDDFAIRDYTWYDYSPPRTVNELDAEIREDIRDELFWSPFVDSDAVTVTVDDGTAHLTGTVDSWGERSAATENAYEGGAVWVDNDLTVAP